MRNQHGRPTSRVVNTPNPFASASLSTADSSNGTDIKAQELVQGGEILDRFSAESPIFTLCIFGQLLTSIIDGRWLTTA